MSEPRHLVTIHDIVADLRQLGLEPGMTVIVHSSLSSLGWVCGGSQAVILALQEVLGSHGTLVMPTHSAVLSDPAYWCNPPVPESWWGKIRETMPAYRSHLTVTNVMGKIPETFRTTRDVVRSNHPKLSFAALGAKKEEIVRGHTLEYSMGEESPLARLYQEDAFILLLGVGYDSCTALHLAEYRAEYEGKVVIKEGAPIFVDGERTWVEYEDVDVDNEDFSLIGSDYESQTNSFHKGKIGEAEARLIPLRELVDFAVPWLEFHRVKTQS